MDLQSIGRAMLIGGIVLAALGGLLMLLGQIPFLSGLGRLPGDIHIARQSFGCFAPIGAMILLSIVLTVALNIIVRLINRQ